MKRRAAFVLATVLSLTGAGCFNRLSTSVPVAIPEIRIERPANGSQTDGSSVEVAGRSNMPTVSVNGNSHLVVNGSFAVPVDLEEGANDISIQAENGYSTTTLHVTVTRTSTGAPQP